MSDAYGLVVLGGGTAGLTAAIGASRLGARVALVEASARTGGDCLWTGCVPSKSLISAANVVHAARTADVLGLSPAELDVDLGRVMERVRAAQDRIAPHDSPERLREEGVEVVRGRAAFAGAGRIVVTPAVDVVDGGGSGAQRSSLRYHAALIATGSRPIVPPIDGISAADPLTTDTVWDLEELPERLLVLGGGPVGCELGQAFARLGCRVTLVELRDRLLLREEPEASEIVRERLTADGVDVRLGTTAIGFAGGVATLGDGQGSVPFDRLLVAVGRQPRTDELGLATVGVATDDDASIEVDRTLRTTGTAIFAAGDVTGGLPFTHAGEYQARIAVGNALFRLRRTASYRSVPWTTFTDPEVGRVGLSERQARTVHGDRVTVASFHHDALDRAVCAGRGDGFTKLVAGPRGRLLGATVVSVTGGETIAAVAALIRSGASIGDVSDTVVVYPTFSRSVERAADEHLAARWMTERTRRITAPIVRGLQRFGAPG